MPSEGMGVDRFVPLAPLTPFTAALGLGVPLGDGASCIGAGVDCASELFSCDMVSLSAMGPSAIGAGDDAAEEDSVFDLNLLSIDGGNVRTMILLCVLMRPFVDGVEGMTPRYVLVSRR
ncbi:hypothetical protein ES702_01586 [subsurface metagenome]